MCFGRPGPPRAGLTDVSVTAAPVWPGRTRWLVALVALSCLLFAYVAGRAYLLPITWDEAYNYLEFTRKGMLLPLRFQGMAANNHYLNTWLTYLTTGLLGVSEISLRFPALVAHGLFLYYTARLSWALSAGWVALCGFAVLNGNPYMLDFFSLSRGYGLAYGMLAGSLWHLYRFLQADLRVGHRRASLGLAMLGVAAHLTLINFLVALVEVMVLVAVRFAPVGAGPGRRVWHALKGNAVELAVTVLVLGAAVPVFRGLRSEKALFYGGTAGLWKDTVIGVLEASLYEKPYAALPFRLSSTLGGVAVLLMLIATWVSVGRVGRSRRPGELFLPSLVFLVCSCVLASAAQHHILGIPYLTRRTALYLLVLTTFVVVTLAGEMARLKPVWRWGLAAGAVLTSVHLLNCLNLRYLLEWKLSADVKRMIADVAAQAPAPAAGPTIVLGIDVEFEAPLNFYRLVDGLTWLNVADRRMKLHPLADFYLYTEADWRAAERSAFTVLKTYPLGGSLLLRRRVRSSRYDLVCERTLDFEGPADSSVDLGSTSLKAAHSGARSGMTDQRHRRSGSVHCGTDMAPDALGRSLVTAEAMIWMKSLTNARARLVVGFDCDGPRCSEQTLMLQDAVHEPRTWFPVAFTGFVPPDVRPGSRVSVYLRNEGGLVYVDDLRMRWLADAR